MHWSVIDSSLSDETVRRQLDDLIVNIKDEISARENSVERLNKKKDALKKMETRLNLLKREEQQLASTLNPTVEGFALLRKNMFKGGQQQIIDMQVEEEGKTEIKKSSFLRDVRDMIDEYAGK